MWHLKLVLKCFTILIFIDINDVLDTVLSQKGEDVRIGVVTHGGDVMFRIDKVK